MESIEPVWLFGAIALASGLFLGVLITRLLNPGSADVGKLKAELEQQRSEMERYKADVNTHFNKTSDLVNDLTQDYVKVYRHLAEGAQTLSETQEFTQVLEQPRGRVLITVEDENTAVEDENTADEDDVSAADSEADLQQPPSDFVDTAAEQTRTDSDQDSDSSLGDTPEEATQSVDDAPEAEPEVEPETTDPEAKTRT